MDSAHGTGAAAVRIQAEAAVGGVRTVYQIGPVIVWCATIGSGMHFLWGPNMYSLGIPHPFQVPVVLLVWLAGTWWGAKAGRNRAHAS